MFRLWLLFVVMVALPAEERLKIGLLCTGSVTDGGWNQLAKEALDQVKREMQAEVVVLQKVTQDKAGDELRTFAADGFHLVIAHGYEYLTPATEVAATTPMKIVVSGADVARPGIVTLDFDVSQASYQLGVIAGTLSKTGKLGFIGGAPFPSVKACYRGFLAGARSVRADVTVAEAYTSWDEPVKSKAQAEAFFAQGIDFVYPNVDAASRGVFEAVKERNVKDPTKPVYAFGCVADHNANPHCPQHLLASAVIRLDAAFRAVTESVRDNTFTPGVVRENLARGTCVTVLNPMLVGTVLSADLQAKVAQAGKDLVGGVVVIPAQ
jgi:basic membrane protein A and related proteins